MKRLDERPRPDVVSDLLGTLRVRSTLFCESRLTAPWGFTVTARDAAAFHLLLSGSCVLEVDGVGETHRLSAGDLVVLPAGHAHALRDHPASPAPELDRLLAAHPDFDGTLVHGGRGAATELLCGGFALEERAANPLLSRLAPVLHVRGEGGRAPAGLDAPIRAVVGELWRGRPSGPARRARRSGDRRRDLADARASSRAVDDDRARRPREALAIGVLRALQ